MDRRGFIRNLIGGVAATAAVRAFPFRVYSFPSQPKLIVLNPQHLRDVNEFLKSMRLAEGPATMNLFGAGTKFNSILLGGRNLAYDGPVYG